MQWSQEFETRHAALDFEHRKILDLINEFDGRLGQHASLEALESILRDFRSCIDHHFAWEERLMAEIGFPGLDSHRTLHRMLIASLKDMVQEMSFRTLPPESLLEFLTNWFVTHTVQDDRDLAAFLQARQIS